MHRPPPADLPADPMHTAPESVSSQAGRGLRATIVRLLTNPDVRIASLLTILVFAVYALLQGLNGRPAEAQHLGGEYYNIGRALADGRGFSDPFGERTGPTAWMPPLYPMLIAVVLSIVKTRSATATVIAILSNLSIVWVGTSIYSIARRARRRLSPAVAMFFYLLWVGAFNYWMLVLTHDVWSSAIAANTIMLAIYHHVVTGRVNTWGWGLLGGALVLISPSLALAWCATVVWVAVRSTRCRRRCLLAGCLALVVATPWVVRNAYTFHQFVPGKSNICFDAYQANYVDDDGVYDDQTMAQHPLGAPNPRFFYARVGEARYTSEYCERFVQAFKKTPSRFFLAVAHRAAAAFVQSVPLDSDHQTGVELLLRQLLYPVPLVGALVGTIARWPGRRLSVALFVVYVAYLLPYVLVAFYVRYLLPLTPVLVMHVFLGCDAIAWRCSTGHFLPFTSIVWRRRVWRSIGTRSGHAPSE